MGMKLLREEANMAEIKRLWKLMCQAEGVPVNTAFVVFSDKNPYQTRYYAAVNRYFQRGVQA